MTGVMLSMISAQKGPMSILDNSESLKRLANVVFSMTYERGGSEMEAMNVDKIRKSIVSINNNTRRKKVRWVRVLSHANSSSNRKRKPQEKTCVHNSGVAQNDRIRIFLYIDLGHPPPCNH
mmetsp:Transcript_6951/g.14783  ORF Transcript_6951/g.14783 Transcript_6951/m.14783 type:complete len:121 (+) Transcript_6951:657-1019(+)